MNKDKLDNLTRKVLNFPYQYSKDKLGKNGTLSSRSLCLALIMLYILSPVDVIPDFLPLLGQVDDIYVFVSLIVGVGSSYLEKNKNNRY